MDFSAILLLLVVVTGVISGGHLLLARLRVASADERAEPSRPGMPMRALSLLVEYSRAFFPAVLLVFVLRSFVVEPFRIPSGSMLPSLYIGDFILVSKYSYGIRMPLVNRTVIPTGAPERGDVMVFRYPLDPSLNFIKRVVGLPGDALEYRGKKLFINGFEVARDDDGVFYSNSPPQAGIRFIESIDDAAYTIMHDSDVRDRNMSERVPPGHYFVMGDNRDHSNDSRYWGFVPESHVVGKAFYIWFSWKHAPESGIRWERLGNRIR